MKCPKCEGKGFTELEHGLVMVECDECKGTKEVPDDNPSDSGAGPVNQLGGGKDTSKPKRSRKQKKGKKATKRAG